MSAHASQPATVVADARFLRVAGVVGLLIAGAGILVGVLEGPGPALSASPADVLAYLQGRSVGLSLGNGIRFALQPLILVFAVGAYRWIHDSGGPWRFVGALGIALVPALGIPANSAATLALWRLPILGTQPEMVVMVWSASMVLFFGAFLFWGVGATGISLAALRTKQLPTWLGIAGVGVGLVGIGSCVGANVLLAREWLLALVLTLFTLFLLVWMVGTSVMMLRAAYRAARAEGTDPSPLPATA